MEMASLNSIRKVKESAPLWVSASSSNEAVNGVGVGVWVGVGGGVGAAGVSALRKSDHWLAPYWLTALTRYT